ncbi:MAG: GntR family transcriptional regulator [Clostridia bacterium]
MKKESLFLQKKKELYQYIKTQKFAGGKLPTEEIFAEQFGISRNMLRELMRDLEREGYLSKQQGLGNFVHTSALNKKMRIDLINDFSMMLTEAGMNVSYNRLEASERDIENMYMLQKDFPNYKIEDFFLEGRMYLIDQIPGIYSMIYIPKDIMLLETGAEKRAEAKGFFEYLDLYCNQKIEQMIIDFDVLSADEWLADKMQLKLHAPVMQWYEIYYNFFDEAVCASISYFNPQIIKFSMLRK